ncbi:hypothetical protein BV25DRAFT_1912611 [Artomyces pyxidatus]|uniref:Uncharacterized protein n=1 Tax=Artomyces pyxidatus TaxID=48021 RepID=A0ACB8TDQ1_9AGAM|nr:hypothetical protein BV25DRAFT_1912611 [Artomyces pyxidatus]
MHDSNAVIFLGAMPVDDFLKDFVPAAPTPAPLGIIDLDESSPAPYDVEFVRAVEANGLLPGLGAIPVSDLEHPQGYSAVSVMLA